MAVISPFLQRQLYDETVTEMADELRLKANLLDSSDSDTTDNDVKRGNRQRWDLPQAAAGNGEEPVAISKRGAEALRRRKRPGAPCGADKVNKWLGGSTDWSRQFQRSSITGMGSGTLAMLRKVSRQSAGVVANVLASRQGGYGLGRHVVSQDSGSWWLKLSLKGKLEAAIPVISPNAWVKTTWDSMIMVFVLYSAVTVPLAFSYGMPHSVVLTSFEWTLTALYIIDIAISFRTAFYNDDGNLVCDSWPVARHYLRTWFPIDFAATVPFDAIGIAAGLGGSQSQLMILAVLKTPRLLRLIKLLRLLDRWRNANMFKVVQLVLLMMLIAHWLACIWYIIARYAPDQDDWGFDTMFDNNKLTWYLSAFYYSFLLLVGDNIVARNNYERVFFILSLIAGACFYSAVVGNMALLVANMNTVAVRFRQKLDMTQDALRYMRVPVRHRERVQAFYDYIMAFSHPGSEGLGFLSELTKGINEDLHMFLHSDTLKRIYLFKDCEPAFIRSLGMRMKIVTFTPREIIFRQGDLGHEMYIIRSGCVAVVSKNNEVMSLLQAGDFFGEIALLTQARRTAKCVALSNLDLAILNLFDLKMLMKAFPDSAHRLQAAARERLHQLQIAGRAGSGSDSENDAKEDADQNREHEEQRRERRRAITRFATDRALEQTKAAELPEATLLLAVDNEQGAIALALEMIRSKAGVRREPANWVAGTSSVGNVGKRPHGSTEPTASEVLDALHTHTVSSDATQDGRGSCSSHSSHDTYSSIGTEDSARGLLFQCHANSSISQAGSVPSVPLGNPAVTAQAAANLTTDESRDDPNASAPEGATPTLCRSMQVNGGGGKLAGSHSSGRVTVNRRRSRSACTDEAPPGPICTAADAECSTAATAQGSPVVGARLGTLLESSKLARTSKSNELALVLVRSRTPDSECNVLEGMPSKPSAGRAESNTQLDAVERFQEPAFTQPHATTTLATALDATAPGTDIGSGWDKVAAPGRGPGPGPVSEGIAHSISPYVKHTAASKLRPVVGTLAKATPAHGEAGGHGHGGRSDGTAWNEGGLPNPQMSISHVEEGLVMPLEPLLLLARNTAVSAASQASGRRSSGTDVNMHTQQYSPLGSTSREARRSTLQASATAAVASVPCSGAPETGRSSQAGGRLSGFGCRLSDGGSPLGRNRALHHQQSPSTFASALAATAASMSAMDFSSRVAGPDAQGPSGVRTTTAGTHAVYSGIHADGDGGHNGPRSRDLPLYSPNSRHALHAGRVPTEVEWLAPAPSSSGGTENVPASPLPGSLNTCSQQPGVPPSEGGSMQSRIRTLHHQQTLTTGLAATATSIAATNGVTVCVVVSEVQGPGGLRPAMPALRAAQNTVHPDDDIQQIAARGGPSSPATQAGAANLESQGPSLGARNTAGLQMKVADWTTYHPNAQGPVCVMKSAATRRAEADLQSPNALRIGPDGNPGRAPHGQSMFPASLVALLGGRVIARRSNGMEGVGGADTPYHRNLEDSDRSIKHTSSVELAALAPPGYEEGGGSATCVSIGHRNSANGFSDRAARLRQSRSVHQRSSDDPMWEAGGDEQDSRREDLGARASDEDADGRPIEWIRAARPSHAKARRHQRHSGAGTQPPRLVLPAPNGGGGGQTHSSPWAATELQKMEAEISRREADLARREAELERREMELAQWQVDAARGLAEAAMRQEELAAQQVLNREVHAMVVVLVGTLAELTSKVGKLGERLDETDAAVTRIEGQHGYSRAGNDFLGLSQLSMAVAANSSHGLLERSASIDKRTMSGQPSSLMRPGMYISATGTHVGGDFLGGGGGGKHPQDLAAANNWSRMHGGCEVLGSPIATSRCGPDAASLTAGSGKSRRSSVVTNPSAAPGASLVYSRAASSFSAFAPTKDSPSTPVASPQHGASSFTSVPGGGTPKHDAAPATSSTMGHGSLLKSGPGTLRARPPSAASPPNALRPGSIQQPPGRNGTYLSEIEEQGPVD